MNIRVRAAAMLVAAALVPLAACSGPASSSRPSPDVGPPTSSSGPALPAGWRWESYGGVEVGVPATWAYGTSDWPWCLNQDHPKPPYVGRPGGVPAIGCLATTPAGGDPAVATRSGGVFVWFSQVSPQAGGPGDDRPLRGERATRIVGTARVEIQAPTALREQILTTLHPVAPDTEDSAGCPTTHPVADDPAWRPAARPEPVPVAAVTGLAACRYALAYPEEPTPRPRAVRPLISSEHLDGAAARTAVAALDAAPVRGGPDAPQDCLPSVRYGDEILLLRVAAAGGKTDVVVRFSGCDHHGIDDGTTVRRLTRPAVAQVFVGSNRPLGGVHGNVAGLVMGTT